VAPPAVAKPRPLHASGQGSTPVGTASWRGHDFPDVSIDLHGLNLDLAHGRLLASLAQALAIGARVILLVTGKPARMAIMICAASGVGPSAPSCSIGSRQPLCRSHRRRSPGAAPPRRHRRGLYRAAPPALRRGRTKSLP
jgi:hypothetical protein